MSTDSEGRPLSDDGQWAWNGSDWVPAAIGSTAPSAGGSEDAGATMIAQSPYSGSGAPPGGQPGYGAPSTPPAGGPGYGGGSPGYGSPAPAYGGAQGFGAPPPKSNRTRLIVMIVSGAVIVIAVVLILVFTVGSSDKKTSVNGAFSCTSPGASGSGTITFTGGNVYALSGGADGGAYSIKGDKLTFQSGTLKSVVADLSNSKTLSFTYNSDKYNCSQS
jgi:hypothetical protein